MQELAAAPDSGRMKRVWYALGCLLAIYPAFAVRDVLWPFDMAVNTSDVFRIVLARNVVNAVLLGGFAVFIARRFPFSERSLPPLRSLFFAGLAVGAGMFFLEGLFVVGSSRLLENASSLPPFWTVTRSSVTGPEVLVLLLSVGAITPIVEEVFFRGVMYRSLAEAMPWWHAVLFSSAVFALLHSASMMPIAFALGAASALLLEKTGSLLPCVLLHAGMNCGFIFYNAAFSTMLRTDIAGIATYGLGGLLVLALGILLVRRLPQPVAHSVEPRYNVQNDHGPVEPDDEE
jgi:membrane protease YdiL (CAAX protease family)